MYKNKEVLDKNPLTDKALEFGKVKWFGGLNNKTGRTNEFGFIDASGEDLYFHKSDILSVATAFIPDAEVVFFRTESRKGPAAVSVQALAQASDDEIVALVRESRGLSPLQFLKLITLRNALAPLELQALTALAALDASSGTASELKNFWHKFAPTKIDNELFPFAPAYIKRHLYQEHFADFRNKLAKLFDAQSKIKTTLDVIEVYGNNLDERDLLIAKQWAPLPDNDASLAKMLSARAAEKATALFYRDMGSVVEDIAITQLDGTNSDWKTHDLLVDENIALDVKNARRAINSVGFYSEHTVARFKLDRREQHVRIAGILSPYLNLEQIKNPSSLESGKSKAQIVFLGETARNSIDRIEALFTTPEFEVMRPGGTVPNWIFNYPDTWYRQFRKDLEIFSSQCNWPESEEWSYVLSKEELNNSIPALCLAGKHLPAQAIQGLESWQVDFYSRLQDLLAESAPEIPIIFFLVLTDFLSRLKQDESHYSPEGYRSLLYIGTDQKRSFPLGAVDPLGIVNVLISSLCTIWKYRAEINLGSLTNFRFGGLGLLQGRSRGQYLWTPLIAYCGGIDYQKDSEGNVRLDINGLPIGKNGKCGNAPLVIGQHHRCSSCARLICSKCGFCSAECQKKLFAMMAEEQRKKAERRNSEMAARTGSPPQWESPPLEAYEGHFYGRT